MQSSLSEELQGEISVLSRSVSNLGLVLRDWRSPGRSWSPAWRGGRIPGRWSRWPCSGLIGLVAALSCRGKPRSRSGPRRSPPRTGSTADTDGSGSSHQRQGHLLSDRRWTPPSTPGGGGGTPAISTLMMRPTQERVTERADRMLVPRPAGPSGPRRRRLAGGRRRVAPARSRSRRGRARRSGACVSASGGPRTSLGRGYRAGASPPTRPPRPSAPVAALPAGVGGVPLPVGPGITSSRSRSRRAPAASTPSALGELEASGLTGSSRPGRRRRCSRRGEAPRIGRLPSRSRAISGRSGRSRRYNASSEEAWGRSPEPLARLKKAGIAESVIAIVGIATDTMMVAATAEGRPPPRCTTRGLSYTRLACGRHGGRQLRRDGRGEDLESDQSTSRAARSPPRLSPGPATAPFVHRFTST